MSKQRSVEDTDTFEERTRITFEVPQRHAKSPANFAVVTYCGSQDGFTNIQEPFRRDIAAESFSWKRTYGQVREVYCHVQFEQYRERPANDAIDSAAAIDFQGPVLSSYWCDCQSLDAYKALGKAQIASWLEQLETQHMPDWVIVVLVRPDGKKTPRARPTPRLEIYERICADFCTKVRDRNRCTFIMDPRSGLGDSDAWHNTIVRFRQLIYDGYETKLRAFEEKLRVSRDGRTKPGWKLSEYVKMRETLATAYQQLSFPEEALLHLDEMSAIISQFVAEAAQNPANSGFQEQCRVPPKKWIGLNVGSKTRVHELKEVLCQKSGFISLLDLRSLLYVRQFELLVELGRGWEVTLRALPLIQNVTAEAKMFDVPMLPGALDCWTFLTCHEIRKLGLQCGDGVPSTNQQDNATLLGLEREKLGRLGYLCGLTASMTPTNEQKALITVLAQAMETPSVSAAVVKLYEALSTSEKFMKTFLELSEMTMGTFKHVGRIRAAKLLGIDLAKFYMEHCSYEKAAGFLLDALKMLRRETWTIPCADVAILYCKCAVQIQQWDQVIKSALLVASCGDLPMPVRLQHVDTFTQTIASHDRDREKMLLADGLFLANFAPNKEAMQDCIAVGQTYQISITLNSTLPVAIPALKCHLVIRSTNSAPIACSRSPIPESENFFLDDTQLRLRHSRIICTSTSMDSAVLGPDAVSTSKSFPGVKCVSSNASRSYRTESFEVTDLSGDVIVECQLSEIKPGVQTLTFFHKFTIDDMYQVAELHVIYTDTFKMIMLSRNSHIIQVLDKPPVCSIEPLAPSGIMWMHLPYEFKISLISGHEGFGDAVIRLETAVDCVKILDYDGNPFSTATLTVLNQHSLNFRVICSAAEPDYSAEILVTLPWRDMPDTFCFKFSSPLKVSTTSHFCAPGSATPTTFIAVAIANRWHGPVSLSDFSMTVLEHKLHSVTNDTKQFELLPKNTLRLIFSSQLTDLDASHFFLFKASYLYTGLNASTAPHVLAMPFTPGVLGSTRLSITTRTSSDSDLGLYQDESVQVFFVISVLNIPDVTFPVFYQIKYDHSFWTSGDETSGSITLHQGKDAEVSCQLTPAKPGRTTLPTLRLFHVKNEDIIPIDGFHVYNDSTCRAVTVSAKHSASQSDYPVERVSDSLSDRSGQQELVVTV